MATYLQQLLAEEDQFQVNALEEESYLQKIIREEEDPIKGKNALELAGMAAMNLPGSVYGVGKDIASAVMNPIDTFQGGVELAKATGNKLGRNLAELVQGQEMEPMPERSEEAANIVGQGLSDRYGSGENILRTAVTDPAGMALDVSGLGVGKLGKLEPLGAIGRTVQKGLEKGKIPERIYADAADINRGLPPDDRLRMGKTGVTEEISPSSSGIGKIDELHKEINAGLNKVIAKTTDDLNMIPTSAVTTHLDDLMRSREGMFEGNFDIAKINQMKKDFLEQYGSQKMMTADQLHRFKTDIYTKAYKRAADPSADVSTGIKTDTMREMGRGAKESLENRVEGYSALNERWGKLAELKPQLVSSAKRAMEMQSSMAGMIKKTLLNPRAQARVAMGLERIKKGDLGWLEKNLNTAEIRVALALAGRNQETLQEENTTPMQIDIIGGVAQ